MKKASAQSLRFPLLIWIYVVLVWIVYRNLWTYPELIEELIFKPFVFIGPVFIWLHVQGKLHKKEVGLVPTSTKKFWSWGIGIGTLLAVENIFTRLFNWHDPILLSLTFLSVAQAILISLATATSEEILYRGFLLQHMLKKWQPAIAIIINALLFMIGHVGLAFSNSNFRGEDLVIYFAFIFISGMVNALIYERTRSVYTSVVSHSLWNFSSTLFIG